MLEWIITHAPDDAFLYLQLVSGKTSWLETNGYQPLWAFVLAPFGLFLEGEVLMWVALVLYFGILIAIPFVVRKLYHTWWGLLVLFIPALLSGNLMMELPLAVLVVFIAVRYKRPETSVLMIYARMDLFPLALMITPVRQWWKLALYYSPWVIFNLVVFGTIFPDSMLHYAYYFVGLSHMLYCLQLQYTIPFLVVGIIGCLRNHKQLLIQFILLFTFDTIRGAPYMWHYVVLPVIIVLGTKDLYEYLSSKVKVKKDKKIMLALLLLPALLAIPSINIHFKYNFVYEWQTAMYESTNISVDGTLGAVNSGIQGYFNDQKVYNLDGVFNHNVVWTDYIIDFEQYIPAEYELVEFYQETSFGKFGLYRRIDEPN